MKTTNQLVSEMKQSAARLYLDRLADYSRLKLFPNEALLAVYKHRLFGLTSNVVIYSKKEPCP